MDEKRWNLLETNNDGQRSTVDDACGAFVEALATNQPGRVAAVFVVSPLLAAKGHRYNDPFIKVFSMALFAWDLWWLLRRPPRT